VQLCRKKKRTRCFVCVCFFFRPSNPKKNLPQNTKATGSEGGGERGGAPAEDHRLFTPRLFFFLSLKAWPATDVPPPCGKQILMALPLPMVFVRTRPPERTQRSNAGGISLAEKVGLKETPTTKSRRARQLLGFQDESNINIWRRFFFFLVLRKERRAADETEKHYSTAEKLVERNKKKGCACVR